jgi:signal transduction histidine kinase
MTRMPFIGPPRSLSAQVFWLTVGIVLGVDILVMMPGMGREWQSCLQVKLAQAELVAILVPGADTMQNARTRDALSALSGTVAITLIGGGEEIPILPENQKLRQDPDVDLDHFGLLGSVWQADREVLGLSAPYVPVVAKLPLRPDTRIEVVLSQAPVAARLRSYAGRMMALSAAVALITGGLVYVVLDRLLVQPMRIMTASIVAFRRYPEYARLSGLKWLSAKSGDEISRAAQELVIMQDDLRTALWRNARLAALGTIVAKISHDLRNILGSALLLAERLRDNNDPSVKQPANALTTVIERAVELVSRTVDEAGGRPPPVSRAPVLLRELVDEVAAFIRQGEYNPGGSLMAIENLVPSGLVLPLDRNQIYRVLVNLLQNAAEAGASRAMLKTEEADGVTQLVVADNGPGLPRKALAGLFRPFTESGREGGTGLGLAIARDLVRAHGGDLLLRKTGPAGTEFVMSLPAMEAAET